MKLALAILLLIPAVVMAGCSEQVQEDQVAIETSAAVSTEKAMPEGGTKDADVWKGEILETMNSGGYSYLKFMLDGKEIWAAGPSVEGLEVGQEAVMAPGMMMSNFHAKSLNRDFAEIYFVGSLEAPGGNAGTSNPHGGMGGMGMGNTSSQPAPGGQTALENAEVDPVEKAAGGYTVAGIHGQAKTIADQTVSVRGRVVKFTANIMGTNWIHIQDGTGDGPTCDLTVTSSATVAVGDVVLVEGPLSVDKDFGAGYQYGVIIEGAKVTKE